MNHLLDKHDAAVLGLVSGTTIAGFCQFVTPILQVVSLACSITLACIAIAARFRKSPPQKK